MKSRYDYMRASVIEDIDGQQYPDPLTINYQAAIDKYNAVPTSYKLNYTDLKKLWVAYYKQTNKVEEDDILYSINGIEHVGLLEPEDTIYLYDTEEVEQFKFKDLSDNPQN